MQNNAGTAETRRTFIAVAFLRIAIPGFSATYLSTKRLPANPQRKISLTNAEVC